MPANQLSRVAQIIKILAITGTIAASPTALSTLLNWLRSTPNHSTASNPATALVEQSQQNPNARRALSISNPLAAPTMISSPTDVNPNYPDIAFNNHTDAFCSAWSAQQPSGTYGIVFKVTDAFGDTVLNATQISRLYTANIKYDPQIIISGDGTTCIVYWGTGNAGYDTFLQCANDLAQPFPQENFLITDNGGNQLHPHCVENPTQSNQIYCVLTDNNPNGNSFYSIVGVKVINKVPGARQVLTSRSGYINANPVTGFHPTDGTSSTFAQATTSTIPAPLGHQITFIDFSAAGVARNSTELPLAVGYLSAADNVRPTFDYVHSTSSNSEKQVIGFLSNYNTTTGPMGTPYKPYFIVRNPMTQQVSAPLPLMNASYSGPIAQMVTSPNRILQIKSVSTDEFGVLLTVSAPDGSTQQMYQQFNLNGQETSPLLPLKPSTGTSQYRGRMVLTNNGIIKTIFGEVDNTSLEQGIWTSTFSKNVSMMAKPINVTQNPGPISLNDFFYVLPTVTTQAVDISFSFPPEIGDPSFGTTNNCTITWNTSTRVLRVSAPDAAAWNQGFSMVTYQPPENYFNDSPDVILATNNNNPQSTAPLPINIIHVNQKPALTVNAFGNRRQGENFIINLAHINGTDVEDGVIDGVRFTNMNNFNVIEVPNGTDPLGTPGTVLNAGGAVTLTRAQLTSNRIRIALVNANAAPSANVQVLDNEGLSSIVAPMNIPWVANQAPVLTQSSNLKLNQNQALSLKAKITVSDDNPDPTNTHVEFLAENAQVLVGSNAQTTCTLAQWNANPVNLLATTRTIPTLQMRMLDSNGAYSSWQTIALDFNQTPQITNSEIDVADSDKDVFKPITNNNIAVVDDTPAAETQVLFGGVDSNGQPRVSGIYFSYASAPKVPITTASLQDVIDEKVGYVLTGSAANAKVKFAIDDGGPLIEKDMSINLTGEQINEQNGGFNVSDMSSVAGTIGGVIVTAATTAAYSHFWKKKREKVSKLAEAVRSQLPWGLMFNEAFASGPGEKLAILVGKIYGQINKNLDAFSIDLPLLEKDLTPIQLKFVSGAIAKAIKGKYIEPEIEATSRIPFLSESKMKAINKYVWQPLHDKTLGRTMFFDAIEPDLQSGALATQVDTHINNELAAQAAQQVDKATPLLKRMQTFSSSTSV